MRDDRRRVQAMDVLVDFKGSLESISSAMLKGISEGADGPPLERERQLYGRAVALLELVDVAAASRLRRAWTAFDDHWNRHTKAVRARHGDLVSQVGLILKDLQSFHRDDLGSRAEDTPEADALAHGSLFTVRPRAPAEDLTHAELRWKSATRDLLKRKVAAQTEADQAAVNSGLYKSTTPLVQWCNAEVECAADSTRCYAHEFLPLWVKHDPESLPKADAAVEAACQALLKDARLALRRLCQARSLPSNVEQSLGDRLGREIPEQMREAYELAKHEVADQGKGPAAESFQIFIDDIDSFERVRAVDRGEVQTQVPGGRLAIPEIRIKAVLMAILSETSGKKDHGGELNDIYTNALVYQGQRRQTAFALKGRGTRGKARLKDFGDDGGQIQRLFLSQADIYCVQYVGPIADEVVQEMRLKTQHRRLQGEPALCCVINGIDTARLLLAYGYTLRGEAATARGAAKPDRPCEGQQSGA